MAVVPGPSCRHLDEVGCLNVILLSTCGAPFINVYAQKYGLSCCGDQKWTFYLDGSLTQFIRPALKQGVLLMHPGPANSLSSWHEPRETQRPCDAACSSCSPSRMHFRPSWEAQSAPVDIFCGHAHQVRSARIAPPRWLGGAAPAAQAWVSILPHVFPYQSAGCQFAPLLHVSQP